MADATKEETIERHTLVGELLAKGHTNLEIIECLQQTLQLTVEGAQALLRSVYDSWSSVRLGLELQAEDDHNWHQHLRMQLLQKALKEPSTPSQRLALQILDSLAGIQGITTTFEHLAPLPIILVEAEAEIIEEPKGEDNES